MFYVFISAAVIQRVLFHDIYEIIFKVLEKLTPMEFIELILINKLDGVILKYPHHDNVDGTVCITGHHLILSSRKEGVRELWVRCILIGLTIYRFNGETIYKPLYLATFYLDYIIIILSRN